MLYTLLAAINADNLLNALVWLVVAGLIFFLLDWFIRYVGLPDPFAKVARCLIGLVAVVLLINAVLSINNHGFIAF